MPVGIKNYSDPAASAEATLADNIVATDPGVWVGVRGLEKKTIEIIINGAATVQIFVSNLPTVPANSDDHAQYGINVTGSGLVEVKVPVKWMKIKVLALTPGASVSAYMQGCP